MSLKSTESTVSLVSQLQAINEKMMETKVCYIDKLNQPVCDCMIMKNAQVM